MGQQGHLEMMPKRSDDDGSAHLRPLDRRGSCLGITRLAFASLGHSFETSLVPTNP